MKLKRRYRQRLWFVVTLAITAIWWFFISEWVEKPQTYRLPILLLTIIVFSGFYHLRAFIRYHKMVKTIRVEEKIGEAPPGSTLFAGNQRFRYAMRNVEAAILVVIAVVLIIGVSHPKILVNKDYGRLVITYFLGTILLTGYLTIRDLIVLDIVKKMGDRDEAILQSSKDKEKPGV